MLPRPASSRKEKPQLGSLLATTQRSLGMLAVNGPATPSSSASSVDGRQEPRESLLSGLSHIRPGLPSPKTTAFVVSCLLWYLSSALSSNTSKALLSSPKTLTPRPAPPFPYPVTLTLAQFFFVHILSAAVASPTVMRHVPGVRKPVTRIVKNPGWEKILDMAKLSVFNVVGHALSTVAISRVPVSTVHTIKALTPLFTVLSFHFFFHIHYSLMTYLSLFPLTLGVMMACTSLSFSANDLVGLGTALASTLIFVAQSIYSKNLIGRGDTRDAKQDRDGKLDKVNILYYSSACSICIMVPMALYYDGAALLGLSSNPPAVPSTASLAWITALVVANGVVQFFQNFLAFSVLMLVSPVTYSIASLFKRVFVICFAIVWFGQSVSSLQWFGIVLTFFGLYLYNDSKAAKSISKGEEKLREEENSRSMALPTTVSGAALSTTLAVKTAADSYKQPGSAAAFRDYSHLDATSPSSARRTASRRLNQDDLGMVGTSPYFKDPRQALPSPPPSRGPSTDEEDDHVTPVTASLHRHSSVKED